MRIDLVPALTIIPSSAKAYSRSILILIAAQDVGTLTIMVTKKDPLKLISDHILSEQVIRSYIIVQCQWLFDSFCHRSQTPSYSRTNHLCYFLDIFLLISGGYFKCFTSYYRFPVILEENLEIGAQFEGFSWIPVRDRPTFLNLMSPLSVTNQDGGRARVPKTFDKPTTSNSSLLLSTQRQE